MLVVSNVYLIKPYAGANVYVLEDTSGIYLVDVGAEGSDEEIFAELESYFGLSPEDIRGVLITHAHPDHVGALPEIIDLSGAKIYVHKDDLELLRKNTGMRTFPDVQLLSGGEVIDVLGGLKVIHAPGHTDGSVVFYKPKEFIISGDVVVSGPRGELKLPWQKYTKDLAKEIASVRMLAKLEFDAVLPGHGPPVTEGGKRKLLALIEALNRGGF